MIFVNKSYPSRRSISCWLLARKNIPSNSPAFLFTKFFFHCCRRLLAHFRTSHFFFTHRFGKPDIFYLFSPSILPVLFFFFSICLAIIIYFTLIFYQRSPVLYVWHFLVCVSYRWENSESIATIWSPALSHNVRIRNAARVAAERCRHRFYTNTYVILSASVSRSKIKNICWKVKTAL